MSSATMSIPLNESPRCSAGLFSTPSETSRPRAPFFSHEDIQMRIKPIQNREKVTHDDVRDDCARMVQRMAQPIAPHETSRKAQFNKVARLTGLGVRRVEKLWRGYVVKPLAQEHATVVAAYRKWLEDAKAQALADLQKLEREHEELAGMAADYAGARWERALATRARVGEVGACAPSNADP